MGLKMACLKNGNSVSIENDDSIYHEKQVKEMCALHALNNLMQDKNAFSKSDLDNLCYCLSPDTYINPHKSMFGTGNYDVNVLMSALQEKHYDTIWFDKRRNIDQLVLESMKGFILNIPTEYKWGVVKIPLRRKHWVAVRKIETQYYNLDSKLDAPQVIGGEMELIAYLKEQVESKEKELLLIVPETVSKSGNWYRTVSENKVGANGSIPKEQTRVPAVEQINSTEIYMTSNNSSDACSNDVFSNSVQQKQKKGYSTNKRELTYAVEQNNS